MLGSLLLTLLSLPTPIPAPEASGGAGGWPSWRGPAGTGAAGAGADPPITWGESANVAWKTPLPGEGKSTPIVHGDRIFLVAAVPTREATKEELDARELFEDQLTEAPTHLVAFLVLALDRRSGEVVWEQVVTERLPVGGVHKTNGFGSFSPVTDGEGLYVTLGSYGVYALDPDTGDVRWSYELGPQRTRRGWGEAGSPALFGEALVVVADQEDQSRIHVLDTETGKVKWKRDRDEPTTWTTPVVVEAGGATQVVVNGTVAVRSYDLETGEVLWHCGGQTVNAIPTPVTDGELVVCASGYRGKACFAFALDARGNLSETEGGVAWSHDEGTPYVSSPLLDDGRMYMLGGNSGRLSCLDMRTGEVLLDRVRLDLANVYASPIAAGGRLYVAGRDGTTVVLRHGEELEVLAVNVLEEGIDATPVAIGEVLYVRTNESLYAIGKP